MTTLLMPAAPASRRTTVAAVGPGWFTPVMGTGIVANAAATLPVDAPLLLDLARVVWVLDVVLLLVVTTATAAHLRRALDDPATAPLLGAPAMALMTVGAGALLVGAPVIGTSAAVVMAAVLWASGTALGVATALVVPWRAVTRHGVVLRSATGTWLVPVVPPVVSAATGPLLLPHLPGAPWVLVMRLTCVALFGLGLVGAAVAIGLVVHRLLRHGAGPAAGVPALWIVLGPLGQSVTAAHALGGTDHTGLGLVYGLPVWTLAMVWLVLVVTVTARTAVDGLPFSMAWWSFTFPIGTVVTGTSALAATTGASTLADLAVGLYAALVAAWLLVATRTVRALRPVAPAPR